MKKRFILGVLLAVMTCFMTGCFKGDIIVNINEDGTSDVQYKMLGVPLLADKINEIKKDASANGMTVKNIKEKEMQGFTAIKHFENVKDMKNLNAFKAETDKNEGLKIQQGWLYDYYIFDLLLAGSNTNDATLDKDDKAMQQAMLAQIDFNFTLNLPIKAESNNADSVSNDGKSLKWNLNISDDNHMQAKVKVWHWEHIIILGISAAIIFIVLLIGIYIIVKSDDDKNKVLWKVIVGVFSILLIAITTFVFYNLFVPAPSSQTTAMQPNNSNDTKVVNKENKNIEVNKKTEIEKSKPNTVLVQPLNIDDCTIGNVKMGDSMASVRGQLGKPIKENKTNNLTKFVYKDVEIELDSNRNNTVVGVVTATNNVYTTRNIHQTSSVEDVKKAYGEGNTKTSWGELDLYEYDFVPANNMKYILRFAVNKSDNKVNYIGCRIPQ